jgi:hypothetical protein
MVKSARACDQGLLRREPTISCYTLDNELGRFNIRRLNIHRSDTKLFIAEKTFVMRSHIVFN